MSKTLEQQIEIMQHFANGGSIEIYKDDKWSDITNSDFKNWNFATFNFRIKKQKETITIEKWLILLPDEDEYKAIETSNIKSYTHSKVPPWGDLGGWKFNDRHPFTYIC